MAQDLPLTSVGRRCGDTGAQPRIRSEAVSQATWQVGTTWTDHARVKRQRFEDPGCHAPLANPGLRLSSRALPLGVRAIRKGWQESCYGRIAVRERAADIMATKTKTIAATNQRRDHELRQMLEDRRRELMHEVQGRIRDVRTDITKERPVLDQGESAEVNIQDDIEFALIQMKAETLNKIELALRPLSEDTYGVCFECGDEIAERRLRALPFAVRCKDCEEARETAEQRVRIMERRGSSSFVAEMSG